MPEHKPNCDSVAKISRLELQRIESIRTSVAADQGVRGKTLIQLAAADGNSMASIKERTVYRAKREIRGETDRYYEIDFAKIPGWIKEFKAKNESSFASYETVEEKKDGKVKKVFHRAFIAYGPNLHGILHAGLDFGAADGAHSKHLLFNGVYLVLASRDAERTR
ncbi:MAG: hypothetical protein NPIRA05_20410 [Nitrospirales bacterium]|nr:MAG: hypothetical protein NPIRA05_20410 [Nitrospirales bacterium]